MRAVKGLLLTLGAVSAALVFTAGPASAGWDDDDIKTSHNNGILNGNIVYTPVNIPVNVCGNGIAILALVSNTAVCYND
jgi:hypothetical protein